jgi:trehalose 6-phosphate synthase/phosphatase
LEATGEHNIFVVSNRLPVRAQKERGRLGFVRSGGGLASALRAVSGVRSWIGWPGATVETGKRPEVTAELAEQGLRPVFLTSEEERYYYVGMCNGTLWPLLHYFPGRIEINERAWPAYRKVNQRFAAAVLEMAGPEDVVWVHDFHLMLLPQMLRDERPDLRIGFFLHVPFPSQELWRIVPQRDELLRGLLGADYIGFHTSEYLRHFRNACTRVLGIEAHSDSISAAGRRVALGVDPLGPDVATFTDLLEGREVAEHMARFADHWQDRRLILGVERLDYSKGIPHKMQAYARLLEHEPARREDTVMLQVLVPSRQENESYRLLLREIEREISRINGKYGTPGRMPLEFMHRSIAPPELAALYRFATAAVVTPVRDGMNLVAHEYVLCQGHERPAGSMARGSLVLSEFAGAALSLTRSLQINPWDTSGLASAMSYALSMPESERADRMSEMYERVVELDSARWARRYLDRLDRAARHNRQNRPMPIVPDVRSSLTQRFAKARRRRMFLDYDGTLRELAQVPEQAAPTPQILDLVRRLTEYPQTDVHVVSGRRRTTLGAWFGHLPVYLCAEHGFAQRAPGGQWREPIDADLSWMPEVTDFLTQVCEEVPGSFIEAKRCGVAWHYRLAEPGYGAWRARELRSTLDRMLGDRPAETLAGHAVLEVRARGVDKGVYVASMLTDLGDDEFVFCVGDDRTDLDMYRVMPASAFVANVGGPAEGAVNVVATPEELRALLAQLLVA